MGNNRRDLLRMVNAKGGLPIPLSARIPFVNHKKDKSEIDFTNVPILLPNVLFEHMYRNANSHFRTLCRGGKQSKIKKSKNTEQDKRAREIYRARRSNTSMRSNTRGEDKEEETNVEQDGKGRES